MIVGLTEHGLPGLSVASHLALSEAEVIFGGPRHLDLVQAGPRGQAWPMPFDLAPVLSRRGQRVVVLASGDPFWFGAGGALSAHLSASEWLAYPAPSTFSLAAARLGWKLEEVTCLGLHARPLTCARPHLTRNARLICLLRDAATVADFAQYLTDSGFGPSFVSVLERLGGPQERIRSTTADALKFTDIAAPAALAITVAGSPGLPRSPGRPDEAFAHDGQITKAPVRAMTLAALAPRPGERLWDVGAGSGSVAVEWCLAGGVANAIEIRADRAAHIATNAHAFGISHRLGVVQGRAPAALAGLPVPDAIFLGGGGNEALMSALWSDLPTGGRFVANAVTLETETLLTRWHDEKGGSLLRIDIAHAAPLGHMRGWQPARPLVQWSVAK